MQVGEGCQQAWSCVQVCMPVNLCVCARRHVCVPVNRCVCAYKGVPINLCVHL